MGNRIGAADGVTPLPNLRHGVLLHFESSNNIVGGASALAGNVIAYNGGSGVRVDAGLPQVRSNTIRANRIHDNDEGGIGLLSGANDNLASPTILGRDPLHGTSCTQCTVEIFSDGDGQGAVFEGTVYSSDGTWSYDGSPVGPNVTATNTDNSNNTSPFVAVRPLLADADRHSDSDDPDRDGDRTAYTDPHRLGDAYLERDGDPLRDRHRGGDVVRHGAGVGDPVGESQPHIVEDQHRHRPADTEPHRLGNAHPKRDGDPLP